MRIEKKVERLAKMLGVEEWDVVDWGYVCENGEKIARVLRYVQLGFRDVDDVYNDIKRDVQNVEFDKIVYRVSTRCGHSRLFLVKRKGGGK